MRWVTINKTTERNTKNVTKEDLKGFIKSIDNALTLVRIAESNNFAVLHESCDYNENEDYITVCLDTKTLRFDSVINTININTIREYLNDLKTEFEAILDNLNNCLQLTDKETEVLKKLGILE